MRVSSTIEFGLLKNILNTLGNLTLKKLLLPTATFNMIIEPQWLHSEWNKLTNSFSSLNLEKMANFC